MAKQKKNKPKDNGSGKGTTIVTTPEIAQGAYSNLARVNHTSDDFKIDFFFTNPEGPYNLVARIVTNPPHMKRLVQALKRNLEKYEEQFGEIEEKKPIKKPELSTQDN